MALRWLAVDDAVLDGLFVLASRSWEPDQLDATWKQTGWELPNGKPLSTQVFVEQEIMFEVSKRWMGVAFASAEGPDGRPTFDKVDGFFITFAYFMEPIPVDEDDLWSKQCHAERELKEFLGEPREKPREKLGNASEVFADFCDPDPQRPSPPLRTDQPTMCAPGHLDAEPRRSDRLDVREQPGNLVEWHADPEAARREFDAVWRHGCAAVEARLGPPVQTGRWSAVQTGGHGHGRWHHATWRLGSRLFVVTQHEEHFSYGAYEAVSLWIRHHPAEANIPVAGEFYNDPLRLGHP